MKSSVGEMSRPLTLPHARVDCPHEPLPRCPPLDRRHTSSMIVPFPVLLMIRVPRLDIIAVGDRLARHELILLDRIDVNADVFAHEPDTECMCESSDFERFAGHGPASSVRASRTPSSFS